MRTALMTRKVVIAALVALLAALAAPAAAQDAQSLAPPGIAASAQRDRSLLTDGTLYSKMLDIPPFAVGDFNRARPAALPALYVGFVGLEVLDGYLTSRGLSNGAAEANPFVRWAVDHSSSLWAVKAGAAAGTIVAAETLWRHNHRTQAVMVMVLSNVVMGVVAAQNAAASNGVH